jgi:hypothetical protein
MTSETPATPEERERAVEAWERLRPTIAPPHMQRPEPDESVQQAALDRLPELVRLRDEPVTVGPDLRRVLDAWQNPAHVGLESQAPTHAQPPSP